MGRLKDLTNRVQMLRSRLLNLSTDRNSCSDSQQRSVQGSGGIPLVRKMCYAVGGVPYQMTSVAMGVSLQIFLLDVVKMEAFYVSMILFVSRAWDAVTDPLVGYLVGRSKWTPIGKLSPWMILSTPFGILSYLLLWFVPRRSMTQAASVLWFLTATCLFETLMSCYNVPYLSLNMFLGGDTRERDSATAYRMCVEMVAMLLASIIQGQVVAVYNTEKEETCQQLDHEAAQSMSPAQTAPLQETEKAFLTSALVLGALFFLCSLILFLGVTEQRAPLSSDDKVRPAYLASLKMLVCHIPFQRLVLGFVFSALAFQMSLGNFALFCSHAAGLGAQFQHLLLVLLISATVAVPLWQIILLSLGKKITVFIGLSLFIPAAIVVACVPSNLPVFMIMCVLMGFSVATVFLLPWSMLPDVVDDFAVKHPSCKDLEPLFFSCFAFCLKLAGGLSVGISTLTLEFVDYRAGACTHGAEVVTALIVLFSPVPIMLLLVGMIFFHFYPINERQPSQLQEQLTLAQPEAAKPLSVQGETSEQPVFLQQPHTAVTSTLHYNQETDLSNKSNSSSAFHHHGQKCSVKSSLPSNGSKRSCSENIRPKFVPSSINLKRTEHRRIPSRHSEGDEPDRTFPEDDHETASSRSHGKSKVSWV